MYYYKARVYSPTLGRFLQTDPIGYQDQFNLYAYVGNDPVNFLDPIGLCSTTDLDGAPAGREIGLCGNTPAEQEFIAQRLADSHSILSNVEIVAIGAGQRVNATFGNYSPTDPDHNEPVNGGRTIEGTRADNSERYIGIVIDPTDPVQVPGVNVETGTSVTIMETPEDIAEHEGGRHVMDHLLGTRASTEAQRETDAARTENNRRERMQNPLRRRENHNGIVLPH